MIRIKYGVITRYSFFMKIERLRYTFNGAGNMVGYIFFPKGATWGANCNSPWGELYVRKYGI